MRERVIAEGVTAEGHPYSTTIAPDVRRFVFRKCPNLKPGKTVIRGYEIQISIRGSMVRKVITSPDGRRFRLEERDMLLVVNSEPECIMKRPYDMFRAIQRYVGTRNMYPFTLTDRPTATNPGRDDDGAINSRHLMFLSIVPLVYPKEKNRNGRIPPV